MRLLAAYGRPWKTKGVSDPHSLPPDGDGLRPHFPTETAEPTAGAGSGTSRQGTARPTTRSSSRPRPGARWRRTRSARSGCPYVVRGFDYGYVGVLWLSDLVWRSDRWAFDLKHVHESGLKHSIAAAKREKETGGPASRGPPPSAPAGLPDSPQPGPSWRLRLVRGRGDAAAHRKVPRRGQEPSCRSELRIRTVRCRYQTCVPLLPLKVAAGRAPETLIGKDEADWAEDWAELVGLDASRMGCSLRRSAETPWTGRSPTVPGASSAGRPRDAIGTNPGGQPRRHRRPSLRGRFTVKQYLSEKTYGAEGSFRHARIELRPLSTNPRHARSS